MSGDEPIFLPFGHRCSSAAILDRCHLGGESLPFDSVVCQLNVIRACLEDDFKQFLAIDNYTKIDTTTANIIDDVVEVYGHEQPSVNGHYADAAGGELTDRSTYHLGLALTHHDLSSPQDYDTYTRRIGRLRDVLDQDGRKIYVHIHRIVGIDDYSRNQASLIAAFAEFSEFMAARCTNICGLFFVLVKPGDRAEPTSIRILKNDLCSVHVVYVNNDFIDAGGPFNGNCEREVKVMTDIVRQVAR
jgi:hypothetical protein